MDFPQKYTAPHFQPLARRLTARRPCCRPSQSAKLFGYPRSACSRNYRVQFPAREQRWILKAVSFLGRTIFAVGIDSTNDCGNLFQDAAIW
jgi:hypothetical protein